MIVMMMVETITTCSSSSSLSSNYVHLARKSRWWWMPEFEFPMGCHGDLLRIVGDRRKGFVVIISKNFERFFVLWKEKEEWGKEPEIARQIWVWKREKDATSFLLESFSLVWESSRAFTRRLSSRGEHRSGMLMGTAATRKRWNNSRTFEANTWWVMMLVTSHWFWECKSRDSKEGFSFDIPFTFCSFVLFFFFLRSLFFYFFICFCFFGSCCGSTLRLGMVLLGPFLSFFIWFCSSYFCIFHILVLKLNDLLLLPEKREFFMIGFPSVSSCSYVITGMSETLNRLCVTFDWMELWKRETGERLFSPVWEGKGVGKRDY